MTMLRRENLFPNRQGFLLVFQRLIVIAQVAVANANGESVGACIVDTGTGSVFIPALENFVV